MNRDQQITAIAEAFAEVLRQWLSRDQWQQVRDRNATAPYQGGACASHDFCDANMAMAEAFEHVMGRSCLPADDSGMTEADCALWNDSWSLARKLYLEASREVDGSHGLLVPFLRQSLALRHHPKLGPEMRADVRKCIAALRHNRAL